MGRFYSAATGGFYESSLHDSMPADAKPISDDLYIQLFRDRPAGKIIVTGEDGLPALADAPGPSKDQLTAVVRAQRDALLREVYDPAVAMLQRAIRMGDDSVTGKLAEFDAWAIALQAIPEQPGFPQDVVWPTQPTREL